MSGLPGKGRGSGEDDGEEKKRRWAQDKNKAPAKPRPKRTEEQKAAINQKRRQQRSDKAEQAKHNPELGADLRKERDERNAKERIYLAQKKEGAKHDPDLKAKLREKANLHAAYQRNYTEQRVIKETALSSGRPETPASITWEKPETLLSYGSPQPKPLNSNRMDTQFQEYNPQDPEGSVLKVPRVTKPPPQKSRPQNPKRSDTKVPRVLESRPPLSSTYGYDDPQTGYAMQPPTNVGRGEQRPSFAAVDPANEQFLASLDAREDPTRTGWRPRPAPANLPSLDQRRENTGRRQRPTGAELNPAVTLSMGNLLMSTTSSPTTSVSHRRSRNSPPGNPDDRATQKPTNEEIKAKMDMKKFLG